MLKILKSYPVVVIGDREFQSVQLGKWLEEKGIAFILRQKKGTSLLLSGEDKYQPLKALDLTDGHIFQYKDKYCYVKASNS